MEPHELQHILAKRNIRLFNVTLNNHTITFIHPSKTVAEWRRDIRKFVSNSKVNGRSFYDSADSAWNIFRGKIDKAGYFEISDIVSDVYEGRVVSTSSHIIDYPDHEDQKDGFGHYGVEVANKAMKNKLNLKKIKMQLKAT
jgi:hypothetical protein